MLLVFNKEKIISYFVAFSTVAIIFMVASIDKDNGTVQTMATTQNNYVKNVASYNENNIIE